MQKYTKEIFVTKANKTHSFKYDYSKFIYVNSTTKGIIICPEHGEFTQRPDSHIQGNKCPHCAKQQAAQKNRGTTKDFIKKASKVHNDFYSYEKVSYTDKKTKVTVTCPIHGDYEVIPENHLRGRTCQKCVRDSHGNKVKKTTEDFILEAIAIHKGVYTYENTKYSKAHDKVLINCPFHGEFSMTPVNHIHNKQGCPVCATTKQGWSYSAWENAGNQSTYFEGFKLYVIKCYNGYESFYKIGKTFTSISKRFKAAFPYDWQTVHVIEGSARAISELETFLHKEYQDHKYIPNLAFAGNTECFSELPDIETKLFKK